MATAELPNRSLFKAPEVCEIAQLQPYVLRSWEAEFPDLGVARGGVSGRVYRRRDVERVLRLKHLLFVEGLTLAGARRRLEEDSAPLPPVEDEIAPASVTTRAPHGAKANETFRHQLAKVEQGLRSLLTLLEKPSGEERAFELQAPTAPEGHSQKRPAKQTKAPKKPAQRRRR